MTFYVVQIKLNGSNPTAKNLEKAKAIFAKYNPDYPFDPKFIDEEYARKLRMKKHRGHLPVYLPVSPYLFHVLVFLAWPLIWRKPDQRNWGT